MSNGQARVANSRPTTALNFLLLHRQLHLKNQAASSLPPPTLTHFHMASWLSNTIDDPALRSSIEGLIQSYPDSASVIRDLISYFQNKIASSSDNDDEREHKKRRVNLPTTKSSLTITACIPDISFQLPARKRFDLVITPTHLALINSKTEDIEYQFAVNDFQLGACVPTPGPSSSKASTFALFLKRPETDPVVFNVPHKGELVIQRSTYQEKASDNDKHQHIIRLLAMEARIKMTTPQKDTYRSSGVSSAGQRANEDYVNAYLKAKEGSLYFLPEGILYGFKKPTVFFPLSCISSTVFCSITQRTFDIALTIRKGHRPLGSSLGIAKSDEEETRIDFSMIEQSEYAAIDEYIKKAQINDRSLDEEFKAPEPKAVKEIEQPAQQQLAAAEEDEEQDQDFEPSESEEDPLEYDSEAGSSDEERQQGEEEEEDEEEETIDGNDEHEGGQTQQRQQQPVPRRRPVAEADEEDIEHTDNEDDFDEVEQDLDGDHVMSEGEAEEEEIEEVLEDEEDEEDDDRSETIGSTSEDEDKDLGYHSHSRRHDELEEAEDELEESD